MIKVQVTVSPNEAKSLIAKAISTMPMVRKALENGKLMLKGGTTVSAVSEELVGVKMAISGRIAQKGAKCSASGIGSFHRLLIDKGKIRDLGTELEIEEAAVLMGRNDVLVTGANAIDVSRKAAIMVGRPLGGSAGILPKIIARGVNTIIAVGWEKLIPCPIEEALAASGNQAIDLAMGMAVGLIPLHGIVVTETDAVSMLTEVKATIIGAGGIMGGEGSTTFVIEGNPSQVEKAWDIVISVKEADLSGVPESLVECHPGCQFCNMREKVGSKDVLSHGKCAYFMPGLAKKVFSGKGESS